MTESGGPPSRLKRAKDEARDAADIVGKTRTKTGKYMAIVAVAALAAALVQGAAVQKIGLGPLQIDFSTSDKPTPTPTPTPTPGPTTPTTTTPAPDPTTSTSVKPVVDAKGVVKYVYPAGTPEARAIVVHCSAKLVGGEVEVTQTVANNTDQPAEFMTGMGGVSVTDAAGRSLSVDILDNSGWQPGPSNSYSTLAAHKSYTGTFKVTAPTDLSTTLTFTWPLVQGLSGAFVVTGVPIEK